MEIIPKLYLNYGIILNYLTILRLYSIVLISEALRVDRYLHIHMYMYLVFPGGAVVKKKKKNSPGNAKVTRDMDLIPGAGRFPWQPTPVFLPRKFNEQRSLVSSSSWDTKGWT